MALAEAGFRATAFAITDVRGDRAHVSVPTLVIHGDVGAPHAVPFTHAERSNDDRLAFLAG